MFRLITRVHVFNCSNLFQFCNLGCDPVIFYNCTLGNEKFASLHNTVLIAFWSIINQL